MDYCEIRPGLPLSRYVECFWFLTGERGGLEGTQRILPDGCMEVVVNLADPVCQCGPDGSRTKQPALLLAGQLERFLLIEPSGTLDLFGIRFQPAGAWAFLRLPLRRLTGQMLALGQISAPLDRALRDQIVPGRPRAAQAAAVGEALLRYVDGAAAPQDTGVEAAVRATLRTRACVSVDALSRLAGWSPRQLERKFEEQVGLGPKQFCQIIRFQSLFQALESGKAIPGAQLAAACGYYDQAHFIKEFERFSGQRPRLFFAEENPLTHQFTRASRMSDSYNT